MIMSAAESSTRPNLTMKQIEEVKGRLWRYALRLTQGNRDNAEDLVQDTLYLAWRYRATFIPYHKSLCAWLCRIARNRWSDICQRELHHRAQSLTGDGVNRLPCPHNAIEEIWRHDTCHYLLSLLAEPYSSVMRFHLLHDYTLRDLAEMYGVSSATVSRWYRCGIRQMQQQAALEAHRQHHCLREDVDGRRISAAQAVLSTAERNEI